MWYIAIETMKEMSGLQQISTIQEESENMQAEETATSASCALCELTGAGIQQVEEINRYILENVNKVDINELSRQVCDEINTIEGKHMTHKQFVRHLHHHMQQQKVVMTGILQDLRLLASNTRDSCLVTCEETGNSMVDHKVMTAYLKVVDQILNVYRTDAMKERQI
jgi:hypothetical protein